MPSGVAKTDIPCLICCITGRSDHIKRHIQRAHSKQAVPEGWKVAPKNSTVWMKLQADNCKARDGVCLQCGTAIKNVNYDERVPYVPTTFTVFNDHRCKAKQVRDRTVSTPKPVVVKEVVKPVVKETVKPAETEDEDWPAAPDLSELYESILNRVEYSNNLDYKTKQEVNAVVEGLNDDYEGEHEMILQMAFVGLAEKIEERDKKIAELQQQLRRLDQENWKLKSQIPEPQDEPTLVITDK